MLHTKMSRPQATHALLIAGLLLPALLPACQQPDRRPAAPIQSAWEAPPAKATAPAEPWHPPVQAPGTQPAPAVATTEPAAPPPAPDAPIAVINDQPITRATLIDLLIESHGVDMLEKLALLAALKQKAGAAGLAVSNEDVEAEYIDALKRISEPVLDSASGTFDRAGAEKLLNDFLLAKNVSRMEFRLRMQQNAYLRKLADRQVTVDDRELPAEYQRTYGERVKIRCLQMTNAESVRKARAALDAGKDFELVARTMSENPVTAANGGLLPPFTRFDDVPKLLRDAAFALPPGQISSTLHENDAYYILRVEQKFPPSSVGIDNVKDELRKRIKDRLVRRRMNEMAGEVFRATDIGIQDEKLRQAFREKYPEARAH